uniref:Disease resistance R13L4/SHOC-2-like LRR domain-containing protein n=1 Tax=Sander lucioperca TaxID=283035 RepID=A0A8D0CRD6_SANLU
ACTQLEVLSLANNQLSSLPDSLCSLTRLKKLNLSHNNISYLPACVGSMKALVFLHLSCNRLENLPENIRSLVELKILIVEGNSNSPLCYLTRLELLNLDFNDIKDVPQVCVTLIIFTSLCLGDRKLHLVHNPLQKPVRSAGRGGAQHLFSYLRAGGGAY